MVLKMVGCSGKIENGLPFKQQTPLDKGSTLKQCKVVLLRSKEVEAALKLEQAKEKCNSSKSKTWDLHYSFLKGKLRLRPGSTFACQLCRKGFPDPQVFLRHLRLMHGTTCELCSKVLSSASKLKDHLRFVHGKSEPSWEKDMQAAVAVECDLCSKKCMSEGALQKHKLIRHKCSLPESSSPVSSEILYTCNFCQLQFSWKSSLRKHMHKHVTQPGHNTHKSKKAFKFSSDMVVAAAGPPVRVYECPHCLTLHANKDRFKKHLGFVLPDSFRQHEVTVDPLLVAKQKEPVHCEVCGGRTANLSFLHTHQALHEELPRPFACPKPCTRRFLFRCQLDRHVLIHQIGSGVAPTSCSETGGGSTKLKKEVMRHKCPMCKKVTSTEARLLAHMACCHREDKYFDCTVCNVCFPSAKSLARHCDKKGHVQTCEDPTSSLVNPSEAWGACPPAIMNSLPSSLALSNPSQTLRPESLCSSDSVSTSDAFSMYFQSLQSLSLPDVVPTDQMAGDLSSFIENLSASNVEAVRLHPSMSSFPADMMEIESPELLPVNGRPMLTQVLNHHDEEQHLEQQEAQFHTLQSVPLDASTAYLHAAIKLKPQILPPPASASSEQIAVDTLLHNPPAMYSKLDASSKEGGVANSIMNMVVDNSLSVSYMPHNVCVINTQSKVKKIVKESSVFQEQSYKAHKVYVVNKQPKVKKGVKESSIVKEEPLHKVCVANKQPMAKKSDMDSSVVKDLTEVGSKETLTVTQKSVSRQNTTKTYTCNSVVAPIQGVKIPSDPVVINVNDKKFDAVLPLEQCDVKEKHTLPSPVTKETSHAALGTSSENLELAADVKAAISSKPLEVKSNAPVTQAKPQTPQGSQSDSLKKSGKPITCPVCKVKLKDRKQFQQHQTDAHSDALLTCEPCKKTFLLAQSLARHKKLSCTHRETFICRSCKMELPTSEELKSHRTEFHLGSVSSVCPVCNKSLSSAQSLKRHLKTHKEESVETSAEVLQEPTSQSQQEKASAPEREQRLAGKSQYAESSQAQSPIAGVTPHSEPMRVGMSPQPECRPAKGQPNAGVVVPEETVLEQGCNASVSGLLGSDEHMEDDNLSDDLFSEFSSMSARQFFSRSPPCEGDTLTSDTSKQCDFCGVSFASDKCLLRHMSSQHFPNTQWQPAQNSSATPTTQPS